MSLIYQVESAPTKGTRAGRMYNILELDDDHVTLAIPGLKFGRFSITRERLLEKAAELGVKPMPRPKPLIAGPSPKPKWFSGFKKFRLVLALGLALASQYAKAQNNFHDKFEHFGHNYIAVVNKGLFAKWVLAEEKSFYLAPDSTTSELMTVDQWNSHRQKLKSNGFNEIDSRYYWNPNTKTVVMLLKDPHKRTGLLHVSTEYGTNIR